MSIRIVSHKLQFRKPAKTSRDVLTSRDVHYVIMSDETGTYHGIGECAPIAGLSKENLDDLVNTLHQLNDIIDHPEEMSKAITDFSSLRFALESAISDMVNGGKRKLFDFDADARIPVNGLIWMNEKQAMLDEARQKIASGYTTIKLKIGGINFEDELDILKTIRKDFKENDLVIRLDANGAFHPDKALEKLKRLSEFQIHSIEQPIKAGQWQEMASLVHQSPIDIALDEELIGIHDAGKKKEMIETIKPAYLILKPSLHGGFSGCDEWIHLGAMQGTQWWATSALESNIGLNAIAQWVATKGVILPQGLGTGQLFANNIQSPLDIESGYFFWNKEKQWNLPGIFD